MRSDTANTLQWYVLVTRPRAEKQVSRRLTETGFENYLPLRRQLRTWSDRKKWIEEPLFSSYIFVKTEERLRNGVFQAGGLVKYLSIGGKAAVLSEEEIERVRRLCSYEGEFIIKPGKIFAGDEVLIIEGHFAGLRGQVLRVDGKDRLKISIAGLGCFASVEIKYEEIMQVVRKNRI